MPPVGFFIRRLLSSVGVVIGVTLITFTLSHLINIDPVVSWFGKFPPSQELVNLYVAQYHLHDPLYIQYFYYLIGLVHLQLGYSPTAGELVSQVIARTLPYTLQLLMFAMFFNIILSLSTGFLSVKYVGGAVDKVLNAFYLVTWASPSYFLALVLIVLFSYAVPIFPTGGGIDILIQPPHPISGLPMLDALLEGNWPALQSLVVHGILPSLALAIGFFGPVSRVLRSSMLEVMNSNFIRAARARGVPQNVVLFGYAFKIALVQVITLLASQVAYFLGSTIFVEGIFSYPGIGLYSEQAVLALDYPGMLGVTLVFAVIILVGNLVADLLIAVIDPRIRLT